VGVEEGQRDSVGDARPVREAPGEPVARAEGEPEAQ
jgi:hypothetical protein